jgi:signal transduction histidine kinase/ligand-binding sensor domain-containing protein
MASAATTLRGQRPSPALGKLNHDVWTIRDGAPSGVRALAQTPDGTLWIGASTGLYQFDGVRFEPFAPPVAQVLASLSVSALRAFPDSSLWIGHVSGGLSVLQRGQLLHYDRSSGLPEGTVTSVERESSGTIWAATTTGLARMSEGRWQRVGPENGYPSGMTNDLMIDRRGALWVSAVAGVFILPRGASQFVRTAPPLDPVFPGPVREAPDGSVWGASRRLGLTRLSDSAGRAVPLQPAAERVLDAMALTIDRHANAWVDDSSGTYRVPLAQVGGDSASHRIAKLLPVERVPLTVAPYGDLVFEDREGSVWVGTGTALERFRETKFTRVTLPEAVVPSIAPGAGGSVWLGGTGSMTAFVVSDEIVQRVGGPSSIGCVYRDLSGGVWLGGVGGIWHAPAGLLGATTRLSKISLPQQVDHGEVLAIARATDGDLWVSIRGGRMKGVFRRRGNEWSLARLPPGFSNEVALTIAADSSGRVWLGYTGSRLVMAAGDSLQVYSATTGLNVGSVSALLPSGPRLWIGGESGLTVMTDGRFRAITTTEVLRVVTGIVETPNGDVWVNGAGGVTHIEAAEVRRALQSPDYHARSEHFDYHDGLEGYAARLQGLPTAIQGTDGRLWFTTLAGIAWLDPRNIKRNRLAPPVQIREVSAAGNRYDLKGHVVLPLRTTQLQVSYTAMSLAIPDRVKFRYRLNGVDTAWTEASTRREAFYTNLKPGSYRFQVIAANEDNLWNEVGASASFEIPPTFTQTKTFLALIGAVVTSAVSLVVLWRQRQLARALHAQFEGQLAERARLARELHDTLLSDMAGVAMQLNAGARRAGSFGGDATLAELLSALSSQVQRSLTEARQSVTAMRTQLPNELIALHVRLGVIAEQTFAKTGVLAQVAHTGSPRASPPAVEAEIVAIVAEAMMNTRRHAQCRKVAVTCTYGGRELRVRVRDDGQGFDATQPTPTGHWGLVGIRERAASIGARLTVQSTGAGTEVDLVVPGGLGRSTWWSKSVS